MSVLSYDLRRLDPVPVAPRPPSPTAVETRRKIEEHQERVRDKREALAHKKV